MKMCSKKDKAGVALKITLMKTFKSAQKDMLAALYGKHRNRGHQQHISFSHAHHKRLSCFLHVPFSLQWDTVWMKELE